MKFWRYSLVTVFAFFSVASSILYTSCQQDSCLELRCRNGGTCAEGFCRCLEGYEGTECEKLIGSRYIGFYDGITQFTSQPSFADSAVVFIKEAPNVIGMKIFSDKDTFFAKVVENTGIFEDATHYVRITKTTATQVELFMSEKVGDTTLTSTFRGNLRFGSNTQ